jgi:long-chain fatty acid transport protein
MSRTFRRRAGIAAGIAIATLGVPGAQAAGFALMEQSASGLGNAYAGAAALAEDASTVWWNPAGMARLGAGRQVAAALHSIMPSARFRNAGSVAGTGTALNGEGGDAGQSAIIPAAYFVTDLAPRWKLGFALNVPFGLSTRYDANWMGRFHAIDSEVETINLNPSLSWAASRDLSVGFGVNWQTGKINLLSGANYGAAWAAILAAGGGPGALGALAPLGTEGQSRIDLEGDAWGWNAGVLWNVTPATRIGVAYRSTLKYEMTGNVRFAGRPTLAGLPLAAAPFGAAFNSRTADGPVTFSLKAPDSLATSVVHALNERWNLLADLTWTGWGKIQSLPLIRDTGATLDTLTFNFRNTLRTSFGANYRHSDAWTFRAGFALDESPVPNAEARVARLPDADRQWFAAGAQYRLSKAATLDFSYARLKIDSAPINNDQRALGRGLVNGSYEASVDILAAQLTYLF